MDLITFSDKFQQVSPDTIRLLQITDTHLSASGQGQIKGVNTDQSLRKVIELAKTHHDLVDLVLATGDLAHDETRQGYLRFQDHFEVFGCPVLCLPGNHDAPDLMRASLQTGCCSTQRSWIRHPWHIIQLNSHVPCQPGGALDAEELLALQQALDNHPNLFTLVAMHHQPVPVGSRWIDTMMIENADELLKIVDAHPQVRGLIWGHVHQEFTAMRGAVHLMASPSTCIQFKPNSENVAYDTELTPGYRCCLLYSDGRIESEVVRLDQQPCKIDLEARYDDVHES